MGAGRLGTASGGRSDGRKTSEERTIRRAKGRLLVRFGTTVADKTGFTKNVSESGLFLHTNNVFRPDTTVQVSVQFPDRVFTFWGRVVWAKRVPSQFAHLLECGMGICFVDPGAEWLAYYATWKKRFGL
jgi:hypothetical protein